MKSSSSSSNSCVDLPSKSLPSALFLCFFSVLMLCVFFLTALFLSAPNVS